MNQSEFQTRMRQARILLSGDYATGYQRGLRRLYHGANFGTEEEHKKWLGLGLNGDARVQLGDGYRAGFTGHLAWSASSTGLESKRLMRLETE